MQKIWKYVQNILTGLLAMCVAMQVYGGQQLSQKSVEDKTEDTIRVVISPIRKQIGEGERLVVHVEVWNVGSKPVFVPKELDTDCGMGTLTFFFPAGPSPKEIDPSVARVATTCHEFIYSFTEKKPPLAVPLTKDWVVLAPGEFYGKELETYSWSKPAKAKIVAQYRVKDYFRPLVFFYGDEVKELPYDNWKGQVTTNSFWIQVVRRAKGEGANRVGGGE